MDNYIKNSHDKLFKETWSNKSNVKSFLENYLPENILDILNFDSLEICKDSFIKKSLGEFFSDMLYKTRFEGKPGYIYFLFEHKSYPDDLIHLQLLEYMLKIWRLDLKQKKSKKLSVILPLVLFHSNQKWKIKDNFASLLDGHAGILSDFIPDFRFILFDLSQYSDDEIKGTIINRIVMLLFKHVFDKDFADKLPDIFSLCKDLSKKETGLQYIESLIKYSLSNVENITPEEFIKKIETALPEVKGGTIMTTLAEQFINKGMEQGLEQGLEQGMEQGLFEGMEFAVDMKFGNTPDSKTAISIIKNIKNIHQLKAIKKSIKKAETASELIKLITS